MKKVILTITLALGSLYCFSQTPKRSEIKTDTTFKAVFTKDQAESVFKIVTSSITLISESNAPAKQAIKSMNELGSILDFLKSQFEQKPQEHLKK